jgi:nitronate monooxygenase
MQSIRNTVRALNNETTRLIQRIESEHEGDLAALMPHISGQVNRKAYASGDTDLGILSLGQSVAFADRVEPLGAIVRRLEDEARLALQRINGLCRTDGD